MKVGQFITKLYVLFAKNIVDSPSALETTFTTLLNLIYDNVRKSSISTLNIYAINDILSFFARHKYLAEVLINHGILNKPVKHGSEYMSTMLGALLNVSILPTNPLQPCEFFNDVTDNVSFLTSVTIVKHQFITNLKYIP